MKKLPAFLKTLLLSPPAAGQGVHSWLYKCARQLHHHMPAEDIVGLLRTAISGCDRAVPVQEIRQAVENSRAAAWKPNRQFSMSPNALFSPTVGASESGGRTSSPVWPLLDADARQVAIDSSDVKSVEDLTKRSPVPCDQAPTAQGDRRGGRGAAPPRYAEARKKVAEAAA